MPSMRDTDFIESFFPFPIILWFIIILVLFTFNQDQYDFFSFKFLFLFVAILFLLKFYAANKGEHFEDNWLLIIYCHGVALLICHK